MIDSPSLLKFIDNLITQKHGSDLSVEGRQQITEELSPRLEKWLILNVKEAGNTAVLTKALADFGAAYLR